MESPSISQNVPITSSSLGGAAGGAGLLSSEKDAKESARAPKFGEVYEEIQAKFGAPPEKPREIKKTLGKDDFLRIMVTQMKNQDPTNPFKAEQMATEIAQFTSVEQLQNVNQNLAKLANQNRPAEQMAMTNLIGKIITVDRQRFSHTENESDVLSFILPKDCARAKASIISEAGEEVFSKELGHQKAGPVSLSWDGIKSNTLPAKSGSFTLRIEAKDEKDQNIDIQTQAQAKVIGVSFSGAEPVFLVGDATRQEKVTLKNIVQIEADQGQQLNQVTQKKSTPNFIPFQKGVGSGPAAGLGAEAAKALENYQKQQVAETRPAAGQPPALEEKGFPNGLHE